MGGNFEFIVYIYTNICIYTYVYIYIYVYIYMNIGVYIYISIYIYVFIYIFMCIYTQPLALLPHGVPPQGRPLARSVAQGRCIVPISNFGEPPDATAHHGRLDRQPSTTLLRLGTCPAGNLPTQRLIAATTLLRLGTCPAGNLPTQRLITAGSTGSQARPSCASGHALQGTSRRNGSSRPRPSCASGHALRGTSRLYSK